MGQRTKYLKTVWSPYLGEWRPFHDNWILKENVACIFNGTAVYCPPQPSIYLAGGSDFWSSSSGSTWTLEESFTTLTCRSICYNGIDTFVRSFGFGTSAQTPTIQYSLDGDNWTTSLSGTTGSGRNSFSTVIWDDTRFLCSSFAIGYKGILESYDGINWSLLPFSLSAITDPTWGTYAIAYNGSKYVAITVSSDTVTVLICYSDDLINWNYTVASSNIIIGSLTSVNGRFYAGTASGSYLYSDDGITWFTKVIKAGGSPQYQTRTFATDNNVLVCGGRFTTSGTGVTGTDQIYYSYDSGTTWNSGSTVSANTYVISIVHDGTRFLAAGIPPNTLSESYDGITWTLVSNPPNTGFGGIWSLFCFPAPYNQIPLISC